MTPPGLWMIVAAPLLVAVFIFVMRWATKPDPAVAKGETENPGKAPSGEPGHQ